MLVKDVMTPDPITVAETSSIQDTARLLTRHRISGLPVVDGDGKVVGVVSEFDLLSKHGTTVADVMTRGVLSVSSDSSIEVVSHLLTDHRIRRVPVIDGHKLVGIVSRSDIIKLMSVYWHCEVCGEAIRGEKAPERCPKCGADSTFVHAMQAPGM